MKCAIIAGLLLLVVACAVHQPRCSGALRPINPPPSSAAANANAAAVLPP